MNTLRARRCMGVPRKRQWVSSLSMETMQLQCGKCGQIMAISLEHLGSQVHCPHCQAIVQTPAKNEPPIVKDEPARVGGWLETAETESIFAPPEPSDDVFGSPPVRPLVEIPPPKAQDEATHPDSPDAHVVHPTA